MEEDNQLITVKILPILFIFLASLIIIVFFKYLGSDRANSRVSVYPIYCNSKVFLNSCDDPGRALGKTTYRVAKRENEITYWLEGQSPQRETNCTIENRQNWSCLLSTGSYEFGFKEGKYWYKKSNEETESYQGFGTDVYFATRDEWVTQQCKDKNPQFLCKFLADFFN